MFIRNSKILGEIDLCESLTKYFIGKKKNGQIKGMINMWMLILSYTIQVDVPNVCTKLRNPRCSSSWEISDTNFLMHYTGVRDGKNEKKSKEVKRESSALWFSFTHVCTCIQNLETLALLGAGKSVTKNFIGEKGKMKNKGNDKNENADSFLHNTRGCTQCLYKISKS